MTVKELRAEYEGKDILIKYMEGEPEYWGRTGTVRRVDDIGQLHGSWGGLAVNLDVDEIEVIA